MNQYKLEFLAFAESLVLNKCSFESWKKNAQTHYHNEDIEEARVRLVQICNDDESIGNELWPLTEEAIVEINRIIVELRGGAVS